jgi:hypothetical protein
MDKIAIRGLWLAYGLLVCVLIGVAAGVLTARGGATAEAAVITAAGAFVGATTLAHLLHACMSTRRTTTRTGPIGASPAPARCVHSPSRSPNRRLSPSYASTDTTASGDSFTNINMPPEQRG